MLLRRRDPVLDAGSGRRGENDGPYKLKLGEHVATILIIRVNMETMECKGFNINVWDIDGQDCIPALCHRYFYHIQSLIFASRLWASCR
jgi:hypothetical protein